MSLFKKNNSSYVTYKKKWLIALLPSLIILIFFVLLPIGYAVVISLFNRPGFSSSLTFVGLNNYLSIFRDKEFWDSIYTGFFYTISTTFFQLVLGIGVALVFNKRFFGRNFFRGLIFFPYLIPSVVTVILWTFLLNGSIGYINFLLQKIGLSPPNWFSEGNIIWTLIIISVWQFFPFVFLAALARLQTIPISLYESARLDGASAVRRFIYITLPQLKKVIISVLILRAIIMLMKFDIPWLLASSQGAGRDLNTPAVYAYRQVFENLRLGRGFAVTVLYIVVLIVVVAVTQKLIKRQYESNL